MKRWLVAVPALVMLAIVAPAPSPAAPAAAATDDGPGCAPGRSGYVRPLSTAN